MGSPVESNTQIFRCDIGNTKNNGVIIQRRDPYYVYISAIFPIIMYARSGIMSLVYLAGRKKRTGTRLRDA